MIQEKLIGAVLLMGGVGTRFGSCIPKQFHPLSGKKVYQHALDTMLASALFDEIILTVPPDYIDLHHENLTIIQGGKTRQESSFLALQAFQKKIDIVLIHDAVRPFVSKKILEDNVLGAIQWGAVDTCIATFDTLVHAPNKKSISSIPPREQFLRGQTPQTFRMDWILQAHEKALLDGIENATDDCQLVLRQDRPIHIVQGEERNLKITTELDLLIAETYFATTHSGYCNYK